MEDRHNGGDFSRSDVAFDEINALTRRYNSGFHNNGKFNKMMDAQPRLLPVFDPLRDRRHAKTPLPAALQLAAQVNGSDFTGTWALRAGLQAASCFYSAARPCAGALTA